MNCIKVSFERSISDVGMCCKKVTVNMDIESLFHNFIYVSGLDDGAFINIALFIK